MAQYGSPLLISFEKQERHLMHRRVSSSRPQRTFRGKSGSAMSSRASSTTSACPEASISSMSAGSDSAPTVATGVATCFLMAAAYGTLQPSSMNMLGCVTPNTSSTSWLPAETWMRSACPSS